MHRPIKKGNWGRYLLKGKFNYLQLQELTIKLLGIFKQSSSSVLTIQYDILEKNQTKLFPHSPLFFRTARAYLLFSIPFWTARHNPFPSNIWVTPFKLSAIWSVFFNQICHLTTFKQKRINSRFLFRLYIYRLLYLFTHSSTNMNINLISTTCCSLVEIL